MLHALLSLMLFVPAPMDAPSEKQFRLKLISDLAAVRGAIDNVDALLVANAVFKNIDTPMPGIIVYTPEEIGADGLHAVLVAGVMADSPAARADIRPGDRVVSIGARRLEHETATVVRMLLIGDTKPLMLTIRRGTTNRHVRVTPRKLSCLQDAARALDKQAWMTKTGELRVITMALMNEIITKPTTMEKLIEVRTEIGNILRALMAMEEPIKDDVRNHIVTSCRIRFE